LRSGGNSFNEEENELDNSQEVGDSELFLLKQSMEYKHFYLEIHLPKTLPCSCKDNINGLNSETEQEEKNIPKDQRSKLLENHLKKYASSNSSQEGEEEEDGWIGSKKTSSSCLQEEEEKNEERIPNIELLGYGVKKSKILTSFSSSFGSLIFFEVSDCSDFIVGIFPKPDDQSVGEVKSGGLTSKEEVSSPNSSMSSSQTLILSLSQTDDPLFENINPTPSKNSVDEHMIEKIKRLRRFYSDLSNITCFMRIKSKVKDILVNWCLEQSIPIKMLYKNSSYNSTTFPAIFPSFFSQTYDMDDGYKVEVDWNIQQPDLPIQDSQDVISYFRTNEWYELSQICIPLLPEVDINTLVYLCKDLMVSEEEIKSQKMLLENTKKSPKKEGEMEEDEESLNIIADDGSVETINVNDQIVIENETRGPRRSNRQNKLPLNYGNPSNQKTINDYAFPSSSSSSSISFRSEVITHQSPPLKESPITKKARRRRRRTLNSNNPIDLSTSSIDRNGSASNNILILFDYPFDYGRSSMSITVKSTDLERLLPPHDKCPQGTDLEKEMMGEEVDESAITNLLEQMLEEGHELNDTLIEFYLTYSRFQGSIFSIDQKYREEPDTKGEMFKIICDKHKLSDDPYYHIFSTHFYSTITIGESRIELGEFHTKTVLFLNYLFHYCCC